MALRCYEYICVTDLAGTSLASQANDQGRFPSKVTKMESKALELQVVLWEERLTLGAKGACGAFFFSTISVERLRYIELYHGRSEVLRLSESPSTRPWNP